MSLLDSYTDVAGSDVVAHLRQLATPLQGLKVVHINSTRSGGGVAEILNKMIPLSQELGLDVHWEVITGDSRFFECTKGMHNTLQGIRVPISENLLKIYEETNATNAERLGGLLQDADIVFIHDPQPAALLQYFPERRGKWVWRCHIDVGRPFRPVWRYLREFITRYDASIFSLPDFAQELPHPQYLIPPSIDPLAEKNVDLPPETVAGILADFKLDPERPLLVQVSRFDRFKDPLGVIRAWQLAKRFAPGLQLVLAGGGAADDPEGEAVLHEVRAAARQDDSIHVLLLPADAHTQINALQRGADIVIQKSLREGFGLTVTEAMWKSKPVIGGNVGGIRLQVVNYHTGFLVDTPEGAALRVRYLLHQKERAQEMGNKGRMLVHENFLITRHLREYLTLILALLHEKNHEPSDRINLG